MAAAGGALLELELEELGIAVAATSAALLELEAEALEADVETGFGSESYISWHTQSQI